MLIIDCHGHYTTAPAPHQDFRAAQLARLENPSLEPPAPATYRGVIAGEPETVVVAHLRRDGLAARRDPRGDAGRRRARLCRRWFRGVRDNGLCGLRADRTGPPLRPTGVRREAADPACHRHHRAVITAWRCVHSLSHSPDGAGAELARQRPAAAALLQSRLWVACPCWLVSLLRCATLVPAPATAAACSSSGGGGGPGTASEAAHAIDLGRPLILLAAPSPWPGPEPSPSPCSGRSVVTRAPICGSSSCRPPWIRSPWPAFSAMRPWSIRP